VTTGADARPLADAYVGHAGDAVRATFERAFFARELERLLAEAPGTRVLDLGCGEGLVAELTAGRLERYLGVDLHPPEGDGEPGFLAHDLRDGLGPVWEEPFDLYFASFGVASHLPASGLERLCREIAAHARRGALVALEALGLYSLEWPALWDTRPGADRTLTYRLAGETTVHPWAPSELRQMFDAAGIEPLRTVDRTVQAGPKTGEGLYWPGLPPVRAALNALVEGRTEGVDGLAAPLPPLPAHPAARVHHGLLARRRALLRWVRTRTPRALARAVWALEPRTGGGFGHGLLAVGRVR
jgi:SAM-dependent methyltransferase